MAAVEKDRLTLFAVELRSTQWEALVAWYRDVLGLEVLLRVVDDRYALLAAGSARLAILGRDDAVPPGSRWSQSSRWSLVFELADLEATRERLMATGCAAPEPTANPEGFREFVVADPDGNRVRLFAWIQRPD